MKITSRQANVLNNLHRITMRPVGGKPTPFLDGEACRLQVNSLAAKGLIAFNGTGRPVKVGDHDGLFVTRWERAGVRRAAPQTTPGAEHAERDPPSGP